MRQEMLRMKVDSMSMNLNEEGSTKPNPDGGVGFRELHSRW